MSKWDKLLARILTLSDDLRFKELQKVLESYGYVLHAPRGGSSHYTFRKAGKMPITIPKHEPIKRVYVEKVREVVEMENTMNNLSIEEYMKLSYKLEIVKDSAEGGYVASYLELPGCLTCADTLEAVVSNAQDAKRAWLEAAVADGIAIPLPDTLDEYSGQFKLRIPKSLHRSLPEHSKQEGISMNRYCVYLLSQNNALHTNKYFKENLQKYLSNG